MKHSWTVAALAAIAFANIASAAAADDPLAARTAASREAVQSFAKSLNGRLVAAIAEGGPAHAIGECNIAAPEISLAESEARGWSVARTSLKVRNPGNAPDDWDMAVLQGFESRKAAGEDVKALEHAEIIREDDGTRIFRYMKGIPTQKVCTTCHGTEIAVTWWRAWTRFTRMTPRADSPSAIFEVRLRFLSRSNSSFPVTFHGNLPVPAQNGYPSNWSRMKLRASRRS